LRNAFVGAFSHSIDQSLHLKDVAADNADLKKASSESKDNNDTKKDNSGAKK
jgi:hypothetical protein